MDDRLPPLPRDRRLQAEWDLLGQLAERNPGRLVDLEMQDSVLNVTLRGTPALPLAGETAGAVPEILSEHKVRLEFLGFFPAAPMEMYLQRPMQHPNIHPETGFVCLWDRHRVSHTVEHAVHKVVAMLGWQLYNREPLHVMQPDALRRLEAEGEAVRRTLAAPGLIGCAGPEPPPLLLSQAANPVRRRLS